MIDRSLERRINTDEHSPLLSAYSCATPAAALMPRMVNLSSWAVIDVHLDTILVTDKKVEDGIGRENLVRLILT